VYATTVDSGGLVSNIASKTLTNAKPVITDLSCVPDGNHVYTLRGKVNDESPGGLIVHIGGDVSGFAGQTVTVGDDGWFEITRTCDDTSSGTITFDVTDWWGVAADQKTYAFNPSGN